MQGSRKKFWIVFSIVCASIFAFVGVTAIATRLKTVVITFTSRKEQSESVLQAGIQDKVLKDGKFSYGKTVLFMDFEENIALIEKLNPFVKVEDVETIFPNKAKVKISERIPFYRVQDQQNNGVWHILDKDFKILDQITDVKNAKYTDSSTYYQKTMQIDAGFVKSNAQIGEFLDNDSVKNIMTEISNGVEVVEGSVSGVNRLEVVITPEQTKYVLVMKNSDINNDEGCEIVIVGNDNLYKKVQAGISCFREHSDNNNDDDLSTKKIVVEQNENGFVGLLKNK